MLFFTLDLGRNGIDEKKPEAGKYAYHMLFFLKKNLSLSMFISFMLFKKKV